MTEPKPSQAEQDKVMLTHTLGQVREAIDCLQLRSPGEAYDRLSKLALRLTRHLHGEGSGA